MSQITHNPKVALGERCCEQFKAQIEQAPVLALGSGTTVDAIVDALNPKRISRKIFAASQATTERLRTRGIHPQDLSELPDEVSLYIDGADSICEHFQLLKGRGLALTNEKRIARLAKTFLCVLTTDKCMQKLEANNTPPHQAIMVEYLQQKKEEVLEQLSALWPGKFSWNAWPDRMTDHGNPVAEFSLEDREYDQALEIALGAITGIVETGLFSLNRPHLVLTVEPVQQQGCWKFNTKHRE